MLATELLHTAARAVDVLAAPPADGGGGVGNLNTTAILAFIGTKIVPILIMVIGAFVISRAGKGEVSKVLTSTGILILGVVIVGGGAAIMAFGGSLINLMFSNG